MFIVLVLKMCVLHVLLTVKRLDLFVLLISVVLAYSEKAKEELSFENIQL